MGLRNFISKEIFKYSYINALIKVELCKYGGKLYTRHGLVSAQAWHWSKFYSNDFLKDIKKNLTRVIPGYYDLTI